jgi:hypothetical protein
VNVTGMRLYSSAVSGIRQPEKLLDSSDRLVFIFPILIANKTSATTSMPLETILRDFISITFLKELFVQNTISIIKMANEIQPLADDRDDLFNANSTHNKVANSMNTASGQVQINQSGLTFLPSFGDPKHPDYKISPQHAGSIQQKIREKTAIITRHIKTDPKLAPLRPVVEMITLGNLIDVPVIVGTKIQQLDTLTLLHILMVSISLKKPIYENGKDNLDEICLKLENLKTEDYWKLLNELLPKEKEPEHKMRERMTEFIDRHSSLKTIKTTTTKVATKIFSPIKSISTKADNYTNSDPEYSRSFDILNTIKSKLNETKLFLRFSLDERLLKSQYGIKTSSERSHISEMVNIKISPHLDKMLMLTISNFSRSLESTGSIPLHSLFNILYPIQSGSFGLPPEDLSFTKLKADIFDDDLLTTIEKLTTQNIGSALIHSLSSSTPDTTKLKMFKNLSGIDLSDDLNKMNSLFQEMDLSSRNFSWQHFEIFNTNLDKISSNCNGSNVKFEKIIGELSPEIRSILQSIKAHISDSLRTFFNKITEQYTPDIQPRILFVGNAQKIDGEDFSRFNSNVENVRTQMIPANVDYLTNIFYFLFLYQFQHTLFNIVRATDIELETTTNDVTTWPNFTLVLPVEIVVALHAALMSKTWDTILRTADNKLLTNEEIGKKTILAPNDTYIKGVVKYVGRLLNIPNLIVVDSKKNDIYYKLMCNSSINKTKITTLETFVKSNLDIQF